MDDYSRGMDMLRLASRAFAVMASGIGYPIGNTTIPSAQVSANLDSKRIEFEINPNFIHNMKDSEIAAVIAHETYHILLGHLGQMADLTLFPKRLILIDAQECIINDGLPGNVGFTTPEGTYRGLERHSQDFSVFSTQEGYDFILKKLEEDKDEDKEENSDTQDKTGESKGGGSGAGTPGDAPQDASEAGDAESAGASEAGEANGDAQDTSCGGPQVTGEAAEGMSDEEVAEAVKDILGKAIDAAVDEMNSKGVEATPELEEFIEDLKDAGVAVSNAPNYGNPNASKDAFATVDRLSGMNLNWVELLAIINPKLKTSGRPKFKDAWHAPRRKMLHSYPDVILPTRRRLDNPNDKKGDSVPTFIIALDMSGSIPERLLKDLASLAQSIPSDLIKAFPITWSDNFKIFDPERPNVICARGGTRINSVQDYAEQVRKAEGVDPYVLVITDGGYNMPHSMDKEKVSTKWYWMAIQTRDKSTILQNTRDYTDASRVFDMKDFV